MPGPCSRPVGGKSKFARQNKEKGAEPYSIPENLQGRLNKFVPKDGFKKPGSYKK